MNREREMFCCVLLLSIINKLFLSWLHGSVLDFLLLAITSLTPCISPLAAWLCFRLFLPWLHGSVSDFSPLIHHWQKECVPLLASVSSRSRIRLHEEQAHHSSEAAEGIHAGWLARDHPGVQILLRLHQRGQTGRETAAAVGSSAESICCPGWGCNGWCQTGLWRKYLMPNRFMEEVLI